MNLKFNKVYNEDCLEVFNKLPNNSIDLIFADPPFNIKLKYDNFKDNLSYNQYCIWTDKWLSEAYRVLKDNGSIYVAIGDEYAAEINLSLKKQNFKFRNWIIWHYTFGQNQSKKFTRSHTHIFYFTKSEIFTWNDIEIRIPSERQLKYKDKRANPSGKIPDDTWLFSRVCGSFKERIKGHPCQMPEALLERIIKVSSNENDLIFDPFGGSGTTAFVAKKLNRNFITSDLSEKYCQIINNRLLKI